MQVGLFYDYQLDLDRYPAFQQCFRDHQPPTLLVWCEHDEIFGPDGARAVLRNLPDAELHLLDTGHFALICCPDPSIASRSGCGRWAARRAISSESRFRRLGPSAGRRQRVVGQPARRRPDPVGPEQAERPDRNPLRRRAGRSRAGDRDGDHEPAHPTASGLGETEALKAEGLELDALAGRGHANERLDQLTVEMLMGVR